MHVSPPPGIGIAPLDTSDDIRRINQQAIERGLQKQRQSEQAFSQAVGQRVVALRHPVEIGKRSPIDIKV